MLFFFWGGGWGKDIFDWLSIGDWHGLAVV